MSRQVGLNSVNCTQCGAGLSVLGGGRVLTHVCGYCGAVLDAQDEYKILSSIGERNHPDSPVQIGMTLKVDGVEFTVIGTIGKQESWGSHNASWVEHQIFSETHGYGWLTYEEGNFTFTRKMRDYDISPWLSSAEVEAAESPPRRRYKGELLKYYETSTAKIDFMEGEFNWVPEIGEESTTVVLLGNDVMVGLREGKTENEVELTRLLPRDEVITEMGLDLDPTESVGRHPLSPYKPIREEGFLRRAIGFSAIVALVLAAALWMMSGPRVLEQSNISLAQPATLVFNITNVSQIAQMRFRTNISNSWTIVGTEVRGPDGEILVTGERLIQFYSGRDSEGAWSEGNRNATLRFNPREAGQHQLTLTRIDGDASPIIAVAIDEGKPTPFWLNCVAALFALAYLGLRVREAAHKKMRFSGSDWHED